MFKRTHVCSFSKMCLKNVFLVGFGWGWDTLSFFPKGCQVDLSPWHFIRTQKLSYKSKHSAVHCYATPSEGHRTRRATWGVPPTWWSPGGSCPWCPESSANISLKLFLNTNCRSFELKTQYLAGLHQPQDILRDELAARRDELEPAGHFFILRRDGDQLEVQPGRPDQRVQGLGGRFGCIQNPKVYESV